MAAPPTSTGFARKRSRANVGAAAIALAVSLIAPAVHGAGTGLPGLEPKLLPPEQAFRFSARALDPQTLEARFDVADGYYLYRDKMRFAVEAGGPTLGHAVLPAGLRKHDEFFGDVETYRGALVVKLPITGGASGQSLLLKADSQGCADVGVCYPPTAQQVRIALPAAGTGPGPVVDAAPEKKGWFR